MRCAARYLRAEKNGGSLKRKKMDFMTSPSLGIIKIKTPPLPKPQEAAKTQADRSVIPEIILINMAKGGDNCHAGSSLETLVPLPIWQRLDQPPQSKVQLARAIVSSWDFKREKKLAGPNLVGIAAVATKFSTPPAIESVAHEDKNDCDRLLLKGPDRKRPRCVRFPPAVIRDNPPVLTVSRRNIRLRPSIPQSLQGAHRAWTAAEILPTTFAKGEIIWTRKIIWITNCLCRKSASCVHLCFVRNKNTYA